MTGPAEACAARGRSRLGGHSRLQPGPSGLSAAPLRSSSLLPPLSTQPHQAKPGSSRHLAPTFPSPASLQDPQFPELADHIPKAYLPTATCQDSSPLNVSEESNLNYVTLKEDDTWPLQEGDFGGCSLMQMESLSGGVPRAVTKPEANFPTELRITG